MTEIVGIDVSKERLDCAAFHSGQFWSCENAPAAMQALVERLRGAAVSLVVMEATGGYERLVVATLAGAAIAVAVVNPRQVRQFAKSTGALAKTDRIDARILAHFGEAVRPPVRPLPSLEQQQLGELLNRRRQIMEALVAEKNRLPMARLGAVRASIAKTIKFLEAQLGHTDGELDRLIEASPVWQAKSDLLRSVKGIGPANARVLIASLPELGTLGRKQIAALVGLAPFANDSGKRQRPRSIGGGRGQVRAALYMAALAAIRSNPPIRDFYQRLIAKGKRPMVALVACMRKLLTILNAMLKTNTPWQHNVRAA